MFAAESTGRDTAILCNGHGTSHILCLFRYQSNYIHHTVRQRGRILYDSRKKVTFQPVSHHLSKIHTFRRQPVLFWMLKNFDLFNQRRTSPKLKTEQVYRHLERTFKNGLRIQCSDAVGIGLTSFSWNRKSTAHRQGRNPWDKIAEQFLGLCVDIKCTCSTKLGNNIQLKNCNDKWI